MKHRAYIRSTGMYVPEKVVTNHDLAVLFDTSDEWIVQRTGIAERRFVEPGVFTSDLAVKAAQNLLSKGEVLADEIDCILFATLSPDFHFPGTGVFMQEKLGWSKRFIPCYDIREQCSGFVYGLQMAQAFIECGMYENVLLVGAELHSNFLEFTNRGRAVAVLFGDAAGACVVSRCPADSPSGILYSEMHADGSGALSGIHMRLFDASRRPPLYYNPRDPQQNAAMYPEMASGQNLFTSAVRRMAEVSRSALDRLGLTVDDIDWILPHQANMRINQMVGQHLGVDEKKILYNIHKYGNTTAATIPLLLAEFTENGTIKRGDMILTVAFGAGFTWGAVVFRY